MEARSHSSSRHLPVISRGYLLVREPPVIRFALTLINENRALQLPEMLKEAVEQAHTVLYIVGTAGLAEGGHRELTVADIDRPGAQSGAQHGTNGASAGHVIAHDEQLEWHTLALS